MFSITPGVNFNAMLALLGHLVAPLGYIPCRTNCTVFVPSLACNLGTCDLGACKIGGRGAISEREGAISEREGAISERVQKWSFSKLMKCQLIKITIHFLFRTQ